MCDDNQLSELPILPVTVRYLHCTGNKLPYEDLEGYYKWYSEWLKVNNPEKYYAKKFNV